MTCRRFDPERARVAVPGRVRCIYRICIEDAVMGLCALYIGNQMQHDKNILLPAEIR